MAQVGSKSCGLKKRRSAPDASMTDRPHMRGQAEMPRNSRRFRTRVVGRFVTWITVKPLSLVVAGCATVPLERAGSLRSDDDLIPSDGLLTRSLLRGAP